MQTSASKLSIVRTASDGGLYRRSAKQLCHVNESSDAASTLAPVNNTCCYRIKLSSVRSMSYMNSFPNRGGTSGLSRRPIRNFLGQYQVPGRLDLQKQDKASNSLQAIKPELEFGYPLDSSTVQSHYGAGWTRAEAKLEGKSARGPVVYQAGLGASSPNTSLNSHNDLLRTDSGNSSLSNADSLSNTSSNESHSSSFQSIAYEHNFGEDFIIFEEEDFIHVNVYVPETQSEVCFSGDLCFR